MEMHKDLDKKFSHYLAGFWSIVSSIYIFLITFVPIPTGNERVVDTMTGFLLGSVVSTIMAYFFGSSSGSAVKSALLADKGSDATSKIKPAVKTIKKVLKDTDAKAPKQEL